MALRDRIRPRSGTSRRARGAAPSTPGLGGPGAPFASVPEAGEERATDDEEGEYGEAPRAEGDVDRCPHHEAAQSPVPPHHPEGVSEGREKGRYAEGGEDKIQKISLKRFGAEWKLAGPKRE